MRYSFGQVYLPSPISEEWQWQLEAHCRTENVDTFYPNTMRGASFRHQVLTAKQICHRCAVLERCRNYALKSAEPYGIWGGLTATERSKSLEEEATNHSASRTAFTSTSHALYA